MYSQRVISSYLVKPHINARRWAGFRTNLVEIRRANPRLVSRTVMALALWTMVAGSANFLISHPAVPDQTQITAKAAAATPLPAPAQQPAAQLVSAKTQVLAADPTGQMLAPIPMALAYSYRNNYDRGQCTWYVAGRRLVPSNWGNAVNWYYRAQNAGWSTGAIPAVGAIAWTPAGAFGHVALVEDISTDYTEVRVSEMNFEGAYTIDYRWVSTNDFKYIY